MVKARGILRTYPAGAAAASKTVTVKKESDDSTITTDTTDADGVWDYLANGSPGPWYWTGTDATPDPDAVRVGSSQSYGSGGAYALYEVVYALRALGNGVIDGFLNELAVTDPNSGPNLSVATGGVVVKGIPAIWHSSATHAVTTAQDATNPKACYLVIEVTGAGEAEEGKAILKDVCGAAAASPSLPALTQTEATYQFPLATFTLGNSASSDANDVTSLADVRTYLLDPTTLVRNPIVSSVVRRTDPTSETTTTSTSGADVTSLTTTLTLVSGVVYDVEVRGFLTAKISSSGQTVQMAVYGNNTGEIGAFISSNSTDYRGLGNVHTVSGITGSGAAISVGMRWKVSGGTATANTGYLLAKAVPRS